MLLSTRLLGPAGKAGGRPWKIWGATKTMLCSGSVQSSSIAGMCGVAVLGMVILVSGRYLMFAFCMFPIYYF